MTRLSHRISTLTPSTILTTVMVLEELRTQGKQVIELVGGEPDYDTPETGKEAGIAAIRANRTRYPPTDGLAELRKALSLKLQEENGLTYTPKQILVASGTKPLITAALMVLADPADEAIVPVPYWVSYPEMCRLAGVLPVLVTCPASNGFHLRPEDLEAAITPRTRVLLLNSPNNPTGAVYSEAQQRALLEVLKKHPKLWVITDEIYEDICYTGSRPVSFATLDSEVAERVITVNGFSKGYAMAGWRVGYAAGPTDAIKGMLGAVGHMSNGGSTISQHAALGALTGDRAFLKTNEREYRERRDLAVSAINRMPGLSCQTPDGGFFIWGDCSGVIGRRLPGGEIIKTDADFVLGALRHANVALLAGGPFGMAPYFRLSYSISLDRLSEGMQRMKAFCESLT
jgi:aspartate aminotransferase